MGVKRSCVTKGSGYIEGTLSSEGSSRGLMRSRARACWDVPRNQGDADVLEAHSRARARREDRRGHGRGPVGTCHGIKAMRRYMRHTRERGLVKRTDAVGKRRRGQSKGTLASVVS